MNKLVPVSALLLAAVITGCQQDPQSANSITRTTPSGSTSTAHPALAYWSSVYQHSRSYSTINVMDTDATHATAIYTCQYTNQLSANPRQYCGSPSWSPDGGSIAFVETTVSSGTTTSAVRALDVSVNSRGAVVTSNLRTIYSTTSEAIRNLEWCATSSTGKIALITKSTYTDGTGTHDRYNVRTVSQSGGSATTLATRIDTAIIGVSWSPDDSKIVFDAWTHLTVIDASTGVVAEDDNLSSLYGIAWVEWARTGNTIAFMGQATSSSNPAIYYLDYGSGNGAYTDGAAGNRPSWSPNNSSLMVAIDGTGILKLNAFSTSETSLSSASTIAGVKWR